MTLDERKARSGFGFLHVAAAILVVGHLVAAGVVYRAVAVEAPEEGQRLLAQVGDLQEQVQQLSNPEEEVEKLGLWDFDGDGKVDIVFLESVSRSLGLERDDWHSVSVHAGATGQRLFSHATTTRDCDWTRTGDVDGNGTCDLLVHDSHGTRAYGFVKAP